MNWFPHKAKDESDPLRPESQVFPGGALNIPMPKLPKYTWEWSIVEAIPGITKFWRTTTEVNELLRQGWNVIGFYDGRTILNRRVQIMDEEGE